MRRHERLGRAFRVGTAPGQRRRQRAVIWQITEDGVEWLAYRVLRGLRTASGLEEAEARAHDVHVAVARMLDFYRSRRSWQPLHFQQAAAGLARRRDPRSASASGRRRVWPPSYRCPSAPSTSGSTDAGSPTEFADFWIIHADAGELERLRELRGRPPGYSFTAADLSLARDFVSRAAVPVDNARLYTRERATALTLQRGLLPRQIPRVPGLDLACRYVPAQTVAEIGGDWFDVIALPEGRCALTVGDVTGHDMTAASLMGQLRTATRTLATLGLAPAQILTRLDQITADLTDAETSATCLYATCDPAAGTWDIASAGHPPPAIARPGHPAAFPACRSACPWAPAWATPPTGPPACTPRAAPWSSTPTGSSKPPPPT